MYPVPTELKDWRYANSQLILWCLIFTAGCSKPNEYQEPPPPEVQVATPRRDKVVEFLDQTGTSQASERVELRARVSGYLVKRLFKDGDAVKAGQTLFVIDEETPSGSASTSSARESGARASVLEARQSKSRESSRAKLNLSEADFNLAIIQLERSKKLVEREALPHQELDSAIANHKKAQAQVESNRADLAQIDASYDTRIMSAESELEAAQAEVRTAELELSYCRINSPIDGRIDSRKYDVGNYIIAGASTVLATVTRVNPIYVLITPSESDLVRIKRSNRAGSIQQIAMHMGFHDDQDDFPFTGQIEYIAPVVDNSTGTVEVRGIFENPNDAVMPGMLVRVRVPADVREDALLVSERAIGFDQGGAFVYAVNSENLVEQRKVVPGTVVSGERVVTGDIQITDRVILDGLLRVRPGMVVVPRSRDSKEVAKVGEAKDL